MDSDREEFFDENKRPEYDEDDLAEHLDIEEREEIVESQADQGQSRLQMFR